MHAPDYRKENHATVGQTVVTGTSPVTGKFSGLIAMTDVVASAVTYEDGYPVTGSWASLTAIPKGVYLPGRFTSITLTSGECVLIHRD